MGGAALLLLCFFSGTLPERLTLCLEGDPAENVCLWTQPTRWGAEPQGRQCVWCRQQQEDVLGGCVEGAPMKASWP